MELKRIAINLCTRDRPSEVALLLESLRVQTNQDWDLFILEDASGTPLSTYHFVNCVLSRLKMENHFIEFTRTPFNYGVSRSRQELADRSKDYELILRIDDDVILEPDFIERLLKVIDSGYDIASGVTPTMTNPTFIRDTQFVKPIINRVIINKGIIELNSDDCGMQYTYGLIIPAHHFRSSALYKTKIHEKVNYYPTRLTKHGFREEEIFSFKAICEGFRIGIDTSAIAWHLNTPSGGERFPESSQLIHFNEQILKEETMKMFKEYGDFIENYNKQFKMTGKINRNTHLLL